MYKGSSDLGLEELVVDGLVGAPKISSSKFQGSNNVLLIAPEVDAIAFVPLYS